MTSQDIFRFRLAGDPALSPDGKTIAWVKSGIDETTNTYRSRIFVTDVDSGETKPFTSGPRDTHPRWSPDGARLAFLGRKKRGDHVGAAQVYVIDADGDEEHPLTDLQSGAGAPVWAPDGQRIGFVARIDERKGLQRVDEASSAAGDPYTRFNEDVLVIRRRRWKSDGVGFTAHRRSHVVTVAVPERLDDGPQAPTVVVEGELDVDGFCWDPTGDRIAFVTQPEPVPGEAYEPSSELRIAKLNGPSTESRLVVTTKRIDHLPSWSPDGQLIAFFGHDSDKASYADTRLFVIRPDGTALRCLTGDVNRSLGDRSVGDTRSDTFTSTGPVWSDGGDSLMSLVNDRGTIQLIRAAVAGGSTTWLTQGEHQVLAYSVSSTADRMALLMSDMLNPGDIYVADADADNVTRLTRLNETLFAERSLSHPERFVVEADDGVEIEGWVMRPLDFEEGDKVPTILQIHGGPMRQYGYTYFHEFQLLASRGYAVVFGNPRGSQGYGEDFCAAIQGERGNRDYRDIMQFMDGAVNQFDFIDTDRLGVAGGSYGGFMTNWIIGHTDRFHAAVSMRSMFNSYAEYGTGDRGYQREDEAGGGTPWENPEGYLKSSPVHHIGNCTTPTLVIHADMDLRCPVDQGELLYAALHRLGVPTEFLRFPGESHDLSRSGKPWHRVFRLDKIVEWFDRWLVKA